MLANLALALLSAALTAALFLLVLLLVDGWDRSPALAAVTVTAVPVAALAAGRVFRGVRAGTRSEAVAGSVLIAGGLTGLALLPGAKLVWTLAPQVLIGLGLGLSVDSLTAAALRDRIPRAVHGGWTIAARHAGVVVGLAILTPIFTADLQHAETPAKEAIASLVLDAPLPASTKLDLAERLGRRLVPNAAVCPTCDPRLGTCACRRRRRRRPQPWSAASRISSARRDPRVPHRLPRRGGTGATGAATRPGAARPGPLMRRLALPFIAVVLVVAVLGVQLAAGGGHYVPLRPANPCAPRPVPPIPAQLEPLAEQIVLLGLDSAACRLSISRERLVLALAETRSLDPRTSAALKAGLATPSTASTAKAACRRCPSFFPKRSTRPISPGSSRRSSARSRPGSSTASSQPHRCYARQSTNSTSTGSSANSTTRTSSTRPSSQRSSRPPSARSSTACTPSRG